MTRGPFHGLRPLLGAGLPRLELAWVTADPPERRRIEVAAELLRRRVAPNGVPLLDPPGGDEADREVWLGRVLHGDRKLGWAGLHRDQFCRHVGVFGTTGSGKTTMCASMLLRLMELGIPWVALDPKRSLRCLGATPTPEPVRVLTTGRSIGATLRFNPLCPPPGSDPASHAAEMVQLLCDTWQGGPAIASVLERAFREAWARPGVPDFGRLLRVVDRMSPTGRAGGWHQSARRLVASIAEGRLGRVFDSPEEGVDHLGVIHTGGTVIETDGLTREEASFLVSTFLLQIHGRLLAGGPREQLRLAVLIDEAEQILVRSNAARESLLDRLIRTARESSLGLIVASQSISRMTPVILSNLGTLVAMRAHQRDDVLTAARMMLMPDDSVPLLGTLGTGQGVCRVPHWPSPIHIEAPRLVLPKGAVDDESVARTGASSSRRDTILWAIEAAVGDSGGSCCSGPNRQREPEQGPGGGVPLADSACSDGREHAERAEPEGKERSSPLDSEPQLAALLKHVAKEPFATVTARYDALGLSRRRGHALRTQIEAAGLARPLRVRTGRGMLTLLELTDEARAWLRRRRAEIRPLNGGLLHAFWQDKLREVLEAKGWEVQLEWASEPGGHRFDVRACKGERVLIAEIETGASNWRRNLKSLADADADGRVVVFMGDEVPHELKAAYAGVDVIPAVGIGALE